MGCRYKCALRHRVLFASKLSRFFSGQRGYGSRVVPYNNARREKVQVQSLSPYIEQEQDLCDPYENLISKLLAMKDPSKLKTTSLSSLRWCSVN